MSKIGKQPIEVPNGVTVSVAAGAVSVKGPKGERKLPVRPEISLSLDWSTTPSLVSPRATSKSSRSMASALKWT
jgi:large subunit ribosomal protein L6